jgi:hypothetical protein
MKKTQIYFDYCELKGEINITQPQQLLDLHPYKIFTNVHKSIKEQLQPKVAYGYGSQVKRETICSKRQ